MKASFGPLEEYALSSRLFSNSKPVYIARLHLITALIAYAITAAVDREACCAKIVDNKVEAPSGFLHAKLPYNLVDDGRRQRCILEHGIQLQYVVALSRPLDLSINWGRKVVDVCAQKWHNIKERCRAGADVLLHDGGGRDGSLENGLIATLEDGILLQWGSKGGRDKRGSEGACGEFVGPRHDGEIPVVVFF